MKPFRQPTKTIVSVHALDSLMADERPSLLAQGMLSLTGFNRGDETSETTWCLGDAALARDLARAINETLRKHGRLHVEKEIAA